MERALRRITIACMVAAVGVLGMAGGVLMEKHRGGHPAPCPSPSVTRTVQPTA